MKRNLTLLLLLGSAALFAQTDIKLEGTLFDQKSNQPIAGKTFSPVQHRQFQPVRIPQRRAEQQRAREVRHSHEPQRQGGRGRL